jgi:hypothetical protein
VLAHALAPGWAVKVGVGAVVVVNAAVLALTSLVQPALDTTEVTLTTLLLPTLLKAAVVKVPVPPEKFMLDVVDAIVLVPLALYQTAYVPLARLAEFTVTTDPFPTHTVVAEGALKPVTSCAEQFVAMFIMPVVVVPKYVLF